MGDQFGARLISNAGRGGVQVTFTYPTKSFVFLPLQIAERTDFKVKRILTVVKLPKFPYNVLRQIRHLARINESNMKLKQICAKEGNSKDK